MRPTLALTFNLAVIVGGTLIAGCGSAPQSPVAPSVPAAAAPAPAPSEASSTAAVVVVEDAFAIGGPNWECGKNGCEPGAGYIYEARFLLRETGGRSGAVIKEITVSNPNLRAGETTFQTREGESCWRSELRLPGGGTLDTFYTDAGSAWLSYCWVGIDALPGVASLPIEVFFKDDYGVAGSVRATITRFRTR